MDINLNSYTAILEGVKTIIATNEHLTRSQMASLAAVATHAPVIVCCYYIGHLLGFDDNLNEKINNLVIFYKYDTINGIEDWK